MSNKVMEAMAVGATVLGLAAAAVLPFAYEVHAAHQDLAPDTRVITLTGIGSAGVWTEEDVNGESYWRKAFSPARPVLRAGEPVAFRLKSSDVVHTFYSPELGIGPVEVYPGHVSKVVITPKQTGVFQYYCTSFCGAPHFGMHGEIVVGSEGQDPPKSEAAPNAYWRTPAAPGNASLVERGKAIFHYRGCVTCHGEGGKGGIRNFNYARGTVPALNALSERMMLFDAADVRAVVGAMERGVSLDSLEASPPVPKFSVVLAQYRSVRDVIRGGSVSAKRDPQGPEPPLQMPSWKGRLIDPEIDAVIAYLLTLEPPADQ